MKGEHRSPATEFKPGHKTGSATQFKKGQKPRNWTGKPFKLANGYMGAYGMKPNGKPGTRLEHTIIAEKVIGRSLKRGEIVHHINMQKDDNRHCNLLICDQIYHRWIHVEMERRWVKEHIR